MQKARILWGHFNNLLGTVGHHKFKLNWEYLQLLSFNLEHLDAIFTIEELKKAVFDLHAEKSPGPDGFIGGSFKKCWGLIKNDLLEAINQFFHLRGNTWKLLNNAFIVLLPKKGNVDRASDFRPISLMHSVAKILCKIMANRLAPELQHMISASQSAFLKGRSIQDNFLFVQNVIRRAFTRNSPLIFLKLDIAKAFDSVYWSYMLEVSKGFGFEQRWTDMIALLLSTSSSRVLLNGCPGMPFLHRRGLRQGDPLSPMLFILAMEPLQKLIALAMVEGLLTPISQQPASLRTSLYADDAALFVNPIRDEIAAIQKILIRFGEISGLMINFGKCTTYKIRCNVEEHGEVLQDFGGKEDSLRCKYLGLPLHTRKPKRAELQPLVDKAAGRVKPWKGKLLNRTGRLTLINSVLTAITTFFLTCFAMDKWAIKKLDKYRRNFLWAGDEEASGSKCLVNWKQCCSLKSLSGLGIKELTCYSRALRLRWCWFEWDDTDRPWRGSQIPCAAIDRDLFSSCTKIILGNGQKANFWKDKVAAWGCTH